MKSRHIIDLVVDLVIDFDVDFNLAGCPLPPPNPQPGDLKRVSVIGLVSMASRRGFRSKMGSQR